MDTWNIFYADMQRIGFSPHQAQAFVVKVAFAATGADATLAQMRQEMRQVLANTKTASKSIRDNLDASYLKYCPGGPK
jgi:hypothetical protein